MDYPASFDTTAFPAGKSLAITRVMSVAALSIFFLLVVCCGVILWANKSRSIDPLIIKIDQTTGTWVGIWPQDGHNHLENQYTATELLQMSLVAKFTQNWFAISNDTAVNDARWKTCDAKTMCSDDNDRPFDDQECALFCLTGTRLFNTFISDIVPAYQLRIANGEQVSLNTQNIQITSQGSITANGGRWQVLATLESNLVGTMQIVAYVTVMHDQNNLYPKNFGYYVHDFYAYRIK